MNTLRKTAVVLTLGFVASSVGLAASDAGIIAEATGGRFKAAKGKYFEKACNERLDYEAEVVDLRSLIPVDIETVKASVEKTGRCVIVHEATRTSGYGAELTALVQEHCFYHL